MKRFKKLKTAIIGALVAATLAGTAQAEPKSFGKVAGHYDTRGKATATVTLGASDLPLGTNLFGFIDVATEKDRFDTLTAPYGEVRLSKKADYGLGVAAEYNRDFSQNEGVTRAGLVFEPNLKNLLPHTFLGLKLYPVSTHEHGMQASLYGNAHFLNGDLTLDGFIDYNFKPGKFVGDLQVGYRIKDNLFCVVEGRYNGFLNENPLGAGIGLEWKL